MSNGQDDLVLIEGFESDALLNHVHGDSHGSRGISTIQGYSVTINYIIGTGVFALPYAFASSGLAFGTFGVLVGAGMSAISLGYVADVVARTQALTRPTDRSLEPNYAITKHTHADYTTLAGMYTGPFGAWFVQILLTLYFYGTLWSYSSVFASSFVTIFFEYALNSQCDIYDNPDATCHWAYVGAVAGYGVIVTCASLMEISEQARVQVFLTIYRFVALGLMLITVMVGIWTSPAYDGEVEHAPFLSFTGVWNWQGYNILTSGAVALCVHANYPDVIYTLSDRSNKNISFITKAALATACFCYIVLGLLCSSYFGSKTEPLVTLNWKDYYGSWHSEAPEHIPIWSTVIKLFILCFPMLDMLSVFPLVCLTVGNNFLSSLGDSLRDRYSYSTLKIGCRLAAAIPPLIMAMILGDIDAIFSYTGLAAFFLEFIIPASLSYLSWRACASRWGVKSANDCEFSGLLSANVFRVLVAVFAISAFVLSVINMN